MDSCAVACDSGCLRKRCSAVRLTLVTTRFRGAGLHAQVVALLVSGLYLAAACCVAVTACGLLAMAGRLPRFVPTLCGPSVAFLVGRLSANIVVRCFGRLDRCATLAYELCLTCDCREAPRCSAADSRRQCPFSLCGPNARAPYGCLHASTRALGSCIRYMFSTLRTPSWCHASALEHLWRRLVVRPHWLALPRPPHLCSWSRMELML